MKIPRYWVRGSAVAAREDEQPFEVNAWGWSESSREEAAVRAGEAARRIARRVEAGDPLPRGYGYAVGRPLREEIVEEIGDDEGGDEETTRAEAGEAARAEGGEAESVERGGVRALVTRNSYGSLVLNTADLMFIDVDVPVESGAARLMRSLKGLFGVRAPGPEEAVRVRIEGRMRERGEYAFRLYRTPAGFRCAVTNRPIRPDGEEAARLLAEFWADPLYARLCGGNQNFRARLTPKFWRCGARRPPGRFPFEDDERERAYRAWEADYAARCGGFAACRFVGQFGTQPALARFRKLIALHDRLCKSDSQLPLA